MEELTDRLDGIVVDVTSPDRMISARVRGSSTDARFEPGAYGQYTETQLAHQLGQLATSSWTRYRREYLEIVDAYVGDPIGDDGIDFGPEGRQFRERLEQLVANGSSADRSISVSSRALVRWDFTIAAGTVRRLSEGEFLVELDTAVSDLLADHRSQVFLLRDEIYDMGMPQWYRRALGLDDRTQSPGTGARAWR